MPKGKIDIPGTLENEDPDSDASTQTVIPRRSARKAHMSKEELVALPTEVTDTPSSYRFLRDAGFITERDTETTLPQLALILLQITKWAKIPTTGTNAIRSVAFILESIESNILVQNIANRVTAALTPQIEQLSAEVANIQTQKPNGNDWEYVCCSLEETTNKLDSHHEALQHIAANLENTNMTIEMVATKIDESPPHARPIDPQSADTSALQTLKTSLEEIKECLPPANPPNSNTHGRPRPESNAAAIATSNLTRKQKETIARSEARDCQVAIKCKMESVQQLTEKDLTTMVTQALQPPTDRNGRPDFYCRSVRKTKGEVVILEMSNKRGAKWLSSHTNRTDFINRFNIDIQILEPTFKTKIEFIPVSLENNNPFHHRDIEAASDLPDNTISKITWMHKPSERKPQQKVAHTFLTFNSPEAANKAIRDSLTIEGKKVLVYRTYPEPMRCFRCQGLQKHLTNECPEMQDTCGTCGKHNHRTPQCTETNADNFYCVNCRNHGHASWSRECPTFVLEKERLRAQHPDHGCKYFPINNDPSTWPDPESPQQPQTNNNNTAQTPPPRLSPHSQQTQAPADDTWTTINRRHPKKTFQAREPVADRGQNKVRPHTQSQLNHATGTQTRLDGFLHHGETQYRNSPEPNRHNDAPADDSPSRPIQYDLYSTNPVS